MSTKKLKYKNFIANLCITKKYVGISIFDGNNRIFNAPKMDRRELNDDKMIEYIYILMEAMFCIHETNKNFRDKYSYHDSYIFFSKIINTKNFKISYMTDETEKIIHGPYSFFYSSKDKIKKLSQLRVEVKEQFDKKPLTYMVKFLLDKPMNEKMLIEKTKNHFIKCFGI